MIKKLSKTEKGSLLRLLDSNPYLNIYPRGFLLGYPFDDSFLKAYANEDISAAVVVCADTAYFYAPSGFDKEEFIAFFDTLGVSRIIVKSGVLGSWLPKWGRTDKSLMVMTRFSPADMQHAALTDATDRRVYDLLSATAHNMPDYTQYRQAKTTQRFYLKGATAVCLERGENDTEFASATASVILETDREALLGAVATHPDYRKRGLASAVLSLLCISALVDGVNPCLMCDNPVAIKVYEQMGFRLCETIAIFYRLK